MQQLFDTGERVGGVVVEEAQLGREAQLETHAHRAAQPPRRGHEPGERTLSASLIVAGTEFEADVRVRDLQIVAHLDARHEDVLNTGIADLGAQRAHQLGADAVFDASRATAVSHGAPPRGLGHLRRRG